MFKFSLNKTLIAVGILIIFTTLCFASDNPNPHWDAELYKKNSILLQQSSAFELIKSLEIKEDSEILDVGCGDGKITIELAKLASKGQVEGFDLSQGMIELAQSDYKGIHNLKFQVGDAESFSYEEKFDWIMSFFCLQWVKDKQKSFFQIAAHLRPNASVAIITTDRNPYLLKIRSELIQQPEFKKYFQDYIDATNVIDDDAYVTYATEAGLKDIKYTQYPKTVIFEDERQLKVFIKMVTPALKFLPSDDLKENFLSQLTKRYLAIIPEAKNTKNQITYTIKTLIAKK